MATSYAGVNVSMPSKVIGRQSEFNAHAVDWVPLGVGEVSILGDSFVLELKLTGARQIAAKCLGNLVRAAVTEDDPRTLVVMTSDTVHSFYLFRFPYQKHAQEFSRLAEAAEAARTVRSPVKQVEAHEQGTKELEAAVSNELKDHCPLVFGGAELYGSDPSSGSEVLLDRGVVVLLDPSDNGARQVGSYELGFYGEDHGVRKPKKQFAIHPKSVLKQSEAGDDEGPAAVFEIQDTCGDAFSISFDDADVAAAFSRDFRVRLRVMQLSLKTVKGQQQAQDVRDQLQEFKQQSLAARLRRFLFTLMLLLILAVIIRFAVLAFLGRRHLAVGILMDDGRWLLAMSKRALGSASGRICALTTGMLLRDDVLQCAQLSTVPSVRHCIEALA
mmetsp:Transcript_15127/g.26808  ORF Transcript_15127/g.26808 Transcript_15127/m.26808 type:complete len:386 (-) Transcript_15127:170-1327(-)